MQGMWGPQQEARDRGRGRVERELVMKKKEHVATTSPVPKRASATVVESSRTEVTEAGKTPRLSTENPGSEHFVKFAVPLWDIRAVHKDVSFDTMASDYHVGNR
jgi:hypothetical protein